MADLTPFPEKFIRGILSKDSQWYLDLDAVDPEKGKALSAESFKQFGVPDTPREDGAKELSINWFDDDGALLLILNEKKGDRFVYRGGACILSTARLDEACNTVIQFTRLRYERKIIDGNKYHGNLLLLPNTPDLIRNMIAMYLAMTVTLEVIDNPNSC